MHKIIPAKEAAQNLEAARIRNYQAAIVDFNNSVLAAINNGTGSFSMRNDDFRIMREEIFAAGYTVIDISSNREPYVKISF